MESNTEIETGSPQELTEADLKTIQDQSQPFVGNWHQLTSTTNWEKGRIILEWRSALVESGAAARLYSDPAWSRLVGEVSAQHVGRLRRTYGRFGETRSEYPSLYWSHFFAALDWHDAEMWLEGAVLNKWSVSKMRFERWQKTGAAKSERPSGDIVVSPEDEGLALLKSRGASPGESSDDVVRMDQDLQISGPRMEGPDFGDDPNEPAAPSSPPVSESKSATDRSKVDVDNVLGELPDDLANPYRQFRDAVLRHKEENWQNVSRLQIITLINDLKRIMRTTPQPVVESAASESENTESENTESDNTE